ncbi:MAG: DUF3846 domain-containing protein [Candidatus Dormibacteraceae bacterium]
MTIKALRLTPDGGLGRVELEPGPDGSHLNAMYGEIGCDLVDCVGLRGDLDLWLDDEGKLNQDWVVNPGASALLQSCGIPDLVAGTALLTGGADEEGNTLGISDETAAQVERLLRGGT